ncbi:hypothetical protein ASPSYDRAFT_34126 [Aspergillus sydowii CBS 593.65]|uniref:Uncharacterized protein n=1 Tax=Aspergillus sydowii CBS 593.65 TaxID=1036612 RepID=A0A1L9T9N5_9EURO|nr:uncharacterized protein ASPSYDRAFT_34126 [Aspergillus sydowii CBS 593.65]OJJ56126.1 hypothetical protein ASPSYDRAFT_34126 [Aspergillus sydowii CBS 593.65]
MHAKYISFLALSSVALASQPTNLPRGYDDVPSLDDWMAEHDTDSIATTTFGSGSFSTSSSSSDSSSDSSFDSSSSSGDDDTVEFAGIEVPKSIISEIQDLPPSLSSKLTDPTEVSSAYKAALDGHPPAWAAELPDGIKDYIGEAWGVELPESTGSSSSSSGSISDDDDDSSSTSSSSGGSGSNSSSDQGSSNSSGDDDDDEDSNSSSDNGGGDNDGAAGMLNPSVLASVVGAVGVLAVAVAL